MVQMHEQLMQDRSNRICARLELSTEVQRVANALEGGGTSAALVGRTC